MIDKILAISGKPGLYRLIAHGKNMLICENLSDKSRVPALQHDKVLSLADIAMYTVDGEIALNSVFAKAKAQTGGKIAPVSTKDPADAQRNWFEQVLPEYDRDRVRGGDIKKFIQWYNILIETGNDDFSEPAEDDKPAETAAAEPEAPEAEAEAPAKKPAVKKTAAKKADADSEAKAPAKKATKSAAKKAE